MFPWKNKKNVQLIHPLLSKAMELSTSDQDIPVLNTTGGGIQLTIVQYTSCTEPFIITSVATDDRL